jgi:hypothetical protein
LASASGLASRQSTSRSIVAPMATKQKRPQWGTPARGARMHATAQLPGRCQQIGAALSLETGAAS